MNHIATLIQKRHTYPLGEMTRPRGLYHNGSVLARQLDVALMANGFKLSQDLLEGLGQLEFSAALVAANAILKAIRELVGNHVRHNPYFISFPDGVPDTLEFWADLLVKYFDATGDVTSNLLDFPEYGTAPHSYDDMVAFHSHLKAKPKANLKVIHRGGSLEDEAKALFRDLATSPVPLNETDRALLGNLVAGGFSTKVDVPVRENRAILNAILLRTGADVEVDTVVDVLRIAAYLSGGDVTLVEKTKFKSFTRPQRRTLVMALDRLVDRDAHKMDDASRYVEPFKRLASYLHPHDFPKAASAHLFFNFVGGKVDHQTYGSRVHAALVKGVETGGFTKAIKLLQDRPGLLIRNVDLILRKGNKASTTALMGVFKLMAKKVSSRVLLGLLQHLRGRTRKADQRLFVNRKGRGHISDEVLPVLPKGVVRKLEVAILSILRTRVPKSDRAIVIDWESIDGVAMPLSEKSKSDGHAVLPRGSTVQLGTLGPNESVRLFTYWHENGERTDFDLSCSLFDKDFAYLGAVGWTNYHDSNDAATYSGDVTSAPNGATEFIDIKLNQLDDNVAYVAPTINRYAGNDFAETKESFFGYMVRTGKGQPFEATTVRTKFAVRGNGSVAIPMVFARNPDGSWYGKWVEVYAKGRDFGNMAEGHKVTTAKLIKSVIEQEFIPFDDIVQIHAKRHARVISTSTKVKIPKRPVTFIGAFQPEGLPPGSDVYTLDRFKALIPD